MVYLPIHGVAFFKFSNQRVRNRSKIVISISFGFKTCTSNPLIKLKRPYNPNFPSLITILLHRKIRPQRHNPRNNMSNPQKYTPLFTCQLLPPSPQSGPKYADGSNFEKGIREFTDLLLVINSATNFPIYLFFFTQFRVCFLQTFCSSTCNKLTNGLSTDGTSDRQKDNEEQETKKKEQQQQQPLNELPPLKSLKHQQWEEKDSKPVNDVQVSPGDVYLGVSMTHSDAFLAPSEGLSSTSEVLPTLSEILPNASEGDPTS